MQFVRCELLAMRRIYLKFHQGVSKRNFCTVFPNLQHFQRRRPFSNKNRRLFAANSSRLIGNNTTEYSEGDNHDIDTRLGHYNVRNSLHSDSQDPLILQINKCASVDQIFSILNKEFENLQPEHISQIVLVLWDLQKIYNESYLQNLVNDDIEGSPEFMMKNYLNKLHDNKDFIKVLQLLEVHHVNLTPSEASCCLLYLKKMGVSSAESVIQQLTEKCEDIVFRSYSKTSSPTLALVDLTRITAATMERKESFVHLNMCLQVLPMALQYLDQCRSAEEFRLLTFLLYNIQVLIVEPILIRYKTRLKDLISSGVLTSQHYSVLLQVADFLTFTRWSRLNVNEVTDICEIVAPEIPNMDVSNIITLHKVFQTNLEPAHIMGALNKQISKHIGLMLNDDRLGTCIKLPQSLFCYVTYSPPEKRQTFEKILSDYMTKIFPTTVSPIFNTLRYIKTPNEQLCHQFWSKTIYYLVRDNADDAVLLKFAHRYLYFSTIGQVYRNLYFERLMLDLLMQKFNEGFARIIPKLFVRMCAFFLAFGYSTNSLHINDMKKVIEQLELVRGQLGALDCLLISRGLQISSITMNKRNTSPVIAEMFHRADIAISDQTQVLASSQKLSLSDVNCLVKCHLNKRTSLNSDITTHTELIQKYISVENLGEQLNSLSIRDLAHNMSECNVIIPSVFEETISYAVKANKRLLGDTVHKVLKLCYLLGYDIKNQDFFSVACAILERDKHVLSALSLLFSCCALAFYHQLPNTLIAYVFSIQFMERLDAEVATCYMQWKYPRRVRWQLMHLNRCVCIEYPQHRVPWFHHKYLQEQIANERTKKTPLERNVLETFKTIWPHALVKAPHYTPYGYKLDMVVTLDEDDNVRTPYSGDVKQKVAISLLEKRDFCRVLEESGPKEGQFQTMVNGANKHRRRHLEMLGFKLVEIPSSLWYSMHMTEPNVKVDFLKQQILENKTS